VRDVVIDGLVEDVSRNGVFLRTPRHVLPGETAEIDLDLPGEEPLRIAVEVVRVEGEPRLGMGLRFVGDGERSRRPLANFIMRQHARG
jgi:hypothetical protein